MGLIEQKIKNKTPAEQAKLAGQEIARAVPSKARTPRENYDIEIVETKPTEKGVEVFVRAWHKNGEQVGFSDGTVEIERIKRMNPILMVRDPNGEYVRDILHPKTGEKIGEQRYREDVEEALLQGLENTLSAISTHGSEKIVKGKVGSTTSTFRPAAGANSPVDGRVREDAGDLGVSWATLHGTATGSNATDTATMGSVLLEGGSGTDQWRTIDRLFFLFDTSSIPDGDTITSATLSLSGSTKSASDPYGISMNIASSSPAANDALATGDFDQVGSTAFSTKISHASWDTSTSLANSFSLNASGIANISKTGISKFSGLEGDYDLPDVEPTWSDDISFQTAYFADEALTADDPELVVEHSVITRRVFIVS